MNTDYRLSVGIYEHPKFLKLLRKLGDHGGLSFLRLLRFTAVNKPDGVLSGMDRDDIAIAAGFTGEQDFAAALIELKLIDDMGDGILAVHDWEQHNPWAFGAEQRSVSARNAVNARWEKHRESLRNAENESEKYGSDTGVIRPVSNSNTPILSSPILSESLPEEDKRGVPPCVPQDAPAEQEAEPDLSSKAESSPNAKNKARPTFEELTAFMESKGLPDEALRFWNHYCSNGWKVGKNPMVSWTHAAANWCIGKKPNAPPATAATQNVPSAPASSTAPKWRYIPGQGTVAH